MRSSAHRSGALLGNRNALRHWTLSSGGHSRAMTIRALLCESRDLIDDLRATINVRAAPGAVHLPVRAV